MVGQPDHFLFRQTTGYLPVWHYRGKRVSTALGLLPCHEVRATAMTNLGSTALIACFNTTYGFISLDYFNIDQSRIEIRLIEINQPL